MWRKTVNFPSKLIPISPKPSPNSPISSSPIHGVRKGGILTQFCSSLAQTPCSPNSGNLGLAKGGFGYGSSAAGAAAINASSVALAPLLKVREVGEVVRHYGQCYWELSKAKLSLLVVATSGAGYVLGSGSAIDFGGLCYTCMGTMMVAASASSLNQVFEKNNDAKMKRTKLRPLPSGRLSISHAAVWASGVGVAGTTLLACKANILAAGLAASNLALYAFVYTPLKQIHPVNTWVGAIVGAIPPLLGWAAASGEISLNAMILPTALYFWQIPHFMALAYLCREDYAAGGFKMYSLADASGKRTALVALRNSLYLLPLGFLAYDWGITSGWFCLESGLLTLAIAATAFSFYRQRTKKAARKMFHASLLYLPVFMSGLLIHRHTDDERNVMETIQGSISELPLIGNLIRDLRNDIDDIKQKKNSIMGHIQSRPPVAYASIAPFPFLPAPVYADSD
ncbi:hypothetical protein Syun_018291 [Stephania yunnanensis]|uniref:Heme O synthase n=1 Tax=Stephania yunnanensis TaxID=152371 RepID=A0AAP0IS12_9MAGN